VASLSPHFSLCVLLTPLLLSFIFTLFLFNIPSSTFLWRYSCYRIEA
jgi:hypothetical protein